MGRNRIVIDFDGSPRAQAAAPRRSARPGRRGSIAQALLIIAVIVFVGFIGAAAGVYFWWRHYRSGPAYTLALLADAAQRNDTSTIDSIFDTDKITDDFVSQVRQRNASSYSSAITSVLPVQTAPSPVSVAPNLRNTIHDEMVAELQRLTARAAGKPFVLIALSVSHFVDITERGETAEALVNIKDDKLRFTMQSHDGGWRIVSIQDDKLAQRIADGIARDMPSPGTQLQDGIRRHLNKLPGRGR